MRQMHPNSKILVSAVEHPSVYELGDVFVPVESNGRVDVQKLEEILDEHKEQISLVSIMAANNETAVSLFAAIILTKEICSLCSSSISSSFCTSTLPFDSTGTKTSPSSYTEGCSTADTRIFELGCICRMTWMTQLFD